MHGIYHNNQTTVSSLIDVDPGSFFFEKFSTLHVYSSLHIFSYDTPLHVYSSLHIFKYVLTYAFVLHNITK